MGSGTGEMILSPGFEWDNYVVNLRFKVVEWGSGDTNFHVAIRRQRDQGCSRYLIYFHRERTELHVGNSLCRDVKITGKLPSLIILNQWHQVHIEVQGSTIRWQVDNNPIQTDTDNTYLQGTLSMYVGSIGKVEFDDILIWST